MRPMAYLILRISGSGYLGRKCRLFSSGEATDEKSSQPFWAGYSSNGCQMQRLHWAGSLPPYRESNNWTNRPNLPKRLAKTDRAGGSFWSLAEEDWLKWASELEEEVANSPSNSLRNFFFTQKKEEKRKRRRKILPGSTTCVSTKRKAYWLTWGTWGRHVLYICSRSAEPYCHQVPRIVAVFFSTASRKNKGLPCSKLIQNVTRSTWM